MSGGAEAGSWGRRATWWLAAAAFFVVVSLGHLEFSLWLVKERAPLFGISSFNQLMPFFTVAGAMSLAAWLAFAIRRSHRPRAWLIYWALWAGCVAAADRFLTYSAAEYAHYPQYALLAWLIARALDPDRRRLAVGKVIFWTTLLGMADELQQYLWITASYSDYLDFNDFLVNLLAGTAGAMIYYCGRPAAPAARMPRFPWIETAIALLIIGAAAAALHTGHIVVEPAHDIAPGGRGRSPDGVSRLYLQRRPGLYGSDNVGPYRGTYRILDPVTGLALMIGAGALFATLPTVLRRQASRAAAWA